MLRQLRLRILAQQLLMTMGTVCMMGALLLLLLGCLRVLIFQSAPWNGGLAAVVFGACVLLSLAWVALRWPSLEAVALYADERLASKDRLITALRLSQTSTGMPALAHRECLAWLTGRDLRPVSPFVWPRAFFWGVLPLVSLFLLHTQYALHEAEAKATQTSADETADDAARHLREMAEIIKQQPVTDDADALKRIAEELEKSAEKLRAESGTREEVEKAALREMSRLEQFIKELQGMRSRRVEDFKALADALKNQPATKEAGEQLDKGNLEAASQALEQASAQLAASGAEGDKAAVESALSQAMEHLAQKEAQDKAMQELVQQIQQAGGDALKQLADALKKMASQQQGKQDGDGQQQQQQKSGSGGKPLSMQELLALLQAMKNGENVQFAPGGAPQAGSPGIAMQDFGQKPPGGKDPGDPSAGPGSPSGQAGSERDSGTTASPFGERQRGGSKGADLALSGRLAEGETLSVMLPTAGGSAKSTKRYKEIYEAMAPAAQEAVLQEDIPIGSRMFIKRYFESIRPQ